MEVMHTFQILNNAPLQKTSSYTVTQARAILTSQHCCAKTINCEAPIWHDKIPGSPYLPPV